MSKILMILISVGSIPRRLRRKFMARVCNTPLLAAGMGLLWSFAVTGCTEWPEKDKLFDVSKSAEVNINWPHGVYFHFVAAIPKNGGGSTEGIVQILENEIVVYETNFNTSNLMKCNWLHDNQVEGYVIGWEKNGREALLDGIVKPGYDYTVRCQIAGAKREKNRAMALLHEEGVSWQVKHKRGSQGISPSQWKWGQVRRGQT